MKPFSAMPPLHSLIGGLTTGYGFTPFALPGGEEAFEAMVKAGRETLKWFQALGGYSMKLREAGFPLAWAAATFAPFDMIGDTLRGTKGIMFDMYRRPEKLIAACEKMVPMKIGEAVAAARMSGNPRVFIPTHKGGEGFMSEEQFKKFYWPTFRDSLNRPCQRGTHPLCFSRR